MSELIKLNFRVNCINFLRIPKNEKINSKIQISKFLNRLHFISLIVAITVLKFNVKREKLLV